MAAVSALADFVEADDTGEVQGQSLLTTGRRAYLAARRPFDVVISAVLLVLCLPLMALLGLAIIAESPGGAIFRQERVGRGGRLFTIYKLRSMFSDSPRYMSKVTADDSSVTRVGRLLRLSGLDELPQLFNVLRGDLNLIGPRPEMPFIVAGFEPWQHRRHEVRPGITGWWQIHHRSGDPMHLAIEEDIHYVRHAGLLIDLRIVAATAWVMARGAAQAIRHGRSRVFYPVAAGSLSSSSASIASAAETPSSIE
jgi:lipopolysaccharide/colanic/teichoic acid biosynthesis glycosyltransferase